MVMCMSQYDDIIHLPRPVSHKHPPMPRESRAAQFGAFAALSGYDTAVRETARLTDERITQEEEQIDRLNRKLVTLAARLDEEPVAAITYFEPDRHKEGGAYRAVEGTVRRIDGFEGVVELVSKTGRMKIPLDAIIALESDILSDDAWDDLAPDRNDL